MIDSSVSYGKAELHEKCGVFGVFTSDAEAARLTFYGLWALQHRGQESSGIVSSDGTGLHQHVGSGLVANVYHEEDLQQLAGTLAIGHNRYSTSGAADDAHCQPVLMRSNQFALAHNGNLPVLDKLERFLSDRDVTTDGLNDSEMMAAAIDCRMSDGMSLPAAVAATYPQMQGAFSAVAIGIDKIVAFRDQCGIRPLCIGTLGEGYVVASESCGLDTVGAEFLRDVLPGEVVTIDRNGLHSQQVLEPKLKLDVFEFVYFARPDSILQGKRVNQVRENMGAKLAAEYPIEADVVIAVPDSAIPAALGYARASGITYENGFIKNRYIHRTFIRPTNALRELDLKMKLNPISEILANKRVIVIDDSIVRGTTMRKIVKMIFDAGASHVHVLISSPPVKYPDFYGINTPDQADLLASTMSVQQICQHIGASSLGYLSFEGMVEATGLPKESLCTSCFTGEYPIPITSQSSTAAKADPETTQTANAYNSSP